MLSDVYVVVSIYHRLVDCGDMVMAGPGMTSIESVWSSGNLAESAVKYYESLNNPNTKYYIIERPINAIVKSKGTL